MEGREYTIITTKITKRMREVIEEYIKRNLHVTISDFVRDAIREKLERDAPHLVEGVFKGEKIDKVFADNR